MRGFDRNIFREYQILGNIDFAYAAKSKIKKILYACGYIVFAAHLRHAIRRRGLIFTGNCIC